MMHFIGEGWGGEGDGGLSTTERRPGLFKCLQLASRFRCTDPILHPPDSAIASVNQVIRRLQQPRWRARPRGEAQQGVIWEGGQRGAGHANTQNASLACLTRLRRLAGGGPGVACTAASQVTCRRSLRHNRQRRQNTGRERKAGGGGGGTRGACRGARHRGCSTGGAPELDRRRSRAGGRAGPSWGALAGGSRLQRPATAVPPRAEVRACGPLRQADLLAHWRWRLDGAPTSTPPQQPRIGVSVTGKGACGGSQSRLASPLAAPAGVHGGSGWHDIVCMLPGRGARRGHRSSLVGAAGELGASPVPPGGPLHRCLCSAWERVAAAAGCGGNAIGRGGKGCPCFFVSFSVVDSAGAAVDSGPPAEYQLRGVCVALFGSPGMRCLRRKLAMGGRARMDRTREWGGRVGGWRGGAGGELPGDAPPCPHGTPAGHACGGCLRPLGWGWEGRAGEGRTRTGGRRWVRRSASPPPAHRWPFLSRPPLPLCACGCHFEGQRQRSQAAPSGNAVVLFCNRLIVEPPSSTLPSCPSALPPLVSSEIPVHRWPLPAPALSTPLSATLRRE